jgi:hypothetical protein
MTCEYPIPTGRVRYVQNPWVLSRDFKQNLCYTLNAFLISFTNCFAPALLKCIPSPN